MSLLRYLARRAGLTVFVLFGVTLITFVLTHVVPADPLVRDPRRARAPGALREGPPPDRARPPAPGAVRDLSPRAPAGRFRDVDRGHPARRRRSGAVPAGDGRARLQRAVVRRDHRRARRHHLGGVQGRVARSGGARLRARRDVAAGVLRRAAAARTVLLSSRDSAGARRAEHLHTAAADHHRDGGGGRAAVGELGRVRGRRCATSCCRRSCSGTPSRA